MGKAVRHVAALAGLQGGEGCVLLWGGHGAPAGTQGLLVQPGTSAAPSGSGSARGTEDEAGATPGCSQAARKPLGLTLRIQGSGRWRKGDSGLPPTPPPTLRAGEGEGLACSNLCSRLPHPYPAAWRPPPPRPQGSGSLLTQPPPASASAPIRSPESIFPGLLPTQIFRGPRGDGVSSCSVGSRLLPRATEIPPSRFSSLILFHFGQ